MLRTTDDLDARIVDHLRRDARTPFTAIADQLGTSEATVRSRVHRMVEAGVIRQFTVRVRGSNVRAIIEVQAAANVETSHVAHAIRDLPGVDEVWELTGDYDIAALVNADSTDGLNDVVDAIRRLGTTSTRTRVILSEIT